MRKHLIAASATLAVLTLAACGGGNSSGASTPAPAACVNAKAAHRVTVVVTHLSGTSVQRCVGFDGDSISGDQAMQQSGIEMQAQQFSFGKAMCQIDNEPKQFTDCFPKDQPYWALFTESGGAAWQPAQTGYATVQLKNGDALGWRYTPATASPAPLPAAPKK